MPGDNKEIGDINDLHCPIYDIGGVNQHSL